MDITSDGATVLTVTDTQSLWRLDLFLADAFPQYSRTLLRKSITAGGVVIDPDTERPTQGRPSYRLKTGQIVRVMLPELPRESVVPENIPLNFLYEDDDIAVVNKPAGMVVHPSRGHWSGTLVAALAFHFAGKLSSVRGPARPGIVHRLDRDTSGAILVAKNDVAHARLATLFQEKRIRKEYLAIVVGEPSLDRDLVDAAITHHPHHREKMTIARPGDDEAKSAQTRLEYERRYRGFTVVRAFPLTGRTHQIRVHLLHRGLPVLCDPLYSSRAQITRNEIAGERTPTDAATVLLARQALHAHRIAFEHPTSGEEIEVVAPLATDIQSVLDALDQHRATNR